MKHLAKRRDIVITITDKGGAVANMELKFTSKKLIANYPIKTITKYFKQIPLYNMIKW